MRMRLTGTLATVVVCCAMSFASAQDHELTLLSKQLESGSLEEKSKAAEVLGGIGPAAADAVPLLVKNLADSDVGLRYEVIDALGRIAAQPKTAVPALTSVLDDPLPLLRHSAIGALRKYGTGAQSAIPKLETLLKDPEPIVSVSAARAIAEIEIELGHTDHAKMLIPVLVAGLKSERSDVATDAVQGLVYIGAPSVPAIKEIIDAKNSVATLNACDALAGIGAGSAEAVESLIAAAKSSDSKLRWHAISALGDIGQPAKAAIPTIVAALSDADTQVRFNAGHALQQFGESAVPALVDALKNEKAQPYVLPVIAAIGPAAKGAVTPLSAMIQAKDTSLQREAIIALAAIGEASKSTVPALIKAVDDTKYASRPAAAFALGKIKAKEAVPSLKNGLNQTDDPILQLASIWALLQIDPTNREYETIALPKLIGALTSERPDMRREAVETLGRMGPRAKSAVPELQKRLKDDNAIVRRETLIALAEIGPDSQSAVTTITKMLAESDPSLRPVACYALGKIGKASAPAIPQLQKQLQSRDPYEKTVAAWALVHIAPDDKTVEVAIPLLAAALHGAANPKIRVEVAETLGKIGNGSHLVKEALQLALKDSDESVRKAAESAIAKLK